MSCYCHRQKEEEEEKMLSSSSCSYTIHIGIIDILTSIVHTHKSDDFLSPSIAILYLKNLNILVSIKRGVGTYWTDLAYM